MAALPGSLHTQQGFSETSSRDGCRIGPAAVGVPAVGLQIGYTRSDSQRQKSKDILEQNKQDVWEVGWRFEIIPMAFEMPQDHISRHKSPPVCLEVTVGVFIAVHRIQMLFF